MKRVFILPTVLAAALLLPAAAAATSWAPLHAPGHSRAAAFGARAAGHAGRAPLRYVPLARTLSGTGTISLNVYQYSGAAEVNAEADWFVYQGADSGSGYGNNERQRPRRPHGRAAASSNNGGDHRLPRQPGQRGLRPVEHVVGCERLERRPAARATPDDHHPEQ